MYFSCVASPGQAATHFLFRSVSLFHFWENNEFTATGQTSLAYVVGKLHYFDLSSTFSCVSFFPCRINSRIFKTAGYRPKVKYMCSQQRHTKQKKTFTVIATGLNPHKVHSNKKTPKVSVRFSVFLDSGRNDLVPKKRLPKALNLQCLNHQYFAQIILRFKSFFV